MNESSLSQPKKIKEVVLKFPWKEVQSQKVQELMTAASLLQVDLADPIQAFRGGEILAPTSPLLSPQEATYMGKERSMVVVPATRKNAERTPVVVYFPTKKEAIRYDATLTDYRKNFGEFVRGHWKSDVQSLPPITQVDTWAQLADGRFTFATNRITEARSIGKKGADIAVHEMNTRHTTPAELRSLVRVLDALHVDTKTYQEWTATNPHTIPESRLHKNNPSFTLRGKEWWIDPSGKTVDRLTELTQAAITHNDLYERIDPKFDVTAALASFINRNITILPHQNGVHDNPAHAAESVVVHSTLYPGNILKQRSKDGTTQFFVTGGDRAVGNGTRGQMIDWLITSASSSPEHQHAMIDEFTKLHPDLKEKRALALFTLYRSMLETAWFTQHNKTIEAQNLATLTLDILKGNGVWKGVNNPVK